MTGQYTPGPWEPTLKGDTWEVQMKDGHTIASVQAIGNQQADATLIAASPYMLEALQALVELIGDEDLPDNGQLSGAAICDMARAAVAVAVGDEELPFAQ